MMQRPSAAAAAAGATRTTELPEESPTTDAEVGDEQKTLFSQPAHPLPRGLCDYTLTLAFDSQGRTSAWILGGHITPNALRPSSHAALLTQGRVQKQVYRVSAHAVSAAGTDESEGESREGLSSEEGSPLPQAEAGDDTAENTPKGERGKRFNSGENTTVSIERMVVGQGAEKCAIYAHSAVSTPRLSMLMDAVPSPTEQDHQSTGSCESSPADDRTTNGAAGALAKTAAEGKGIIVFGGVNSFGRATNQCFMLCASTGTCSSDDAPSHPLSFTLWPPPAGVPPQPRSLHSSCLTLDEKMFIFGGRSATGKLLGDLHYLDLHTNMWVGLDENAFSGPVPSARLQALLVPLPAPLSPQRTDDDEGNTTEADSMLLLAGGRGRGSAALHSDVYCLSTKFRYWCQIPASNEASQQTLSAVMPPGVGGLLAGRATAFVEQGGSLDTVGQETGEVQEKFQLTVVDRQLTMMGDGDDDLRDTTTEIQIEVKRGLLTDTVSPYLCVRRTRAAVPPGVVAQPQRPFVCCSTPLPVWESSKRINDSVLLTVQTKPTAAVLLQPLRGGSTCPRTDGSSAQQQEPTRQSDTTMESGEEMVGQQDDLPSQGQERESSAIDEQEESTVQVQDEGYDGVDLAAPLPFYRCSDVWFVIFTFCTLKEIHIIQRTCYHAYEAAEDDYLWELMEQCDVGKNNFFEVPHIRTVGSLDAMKPAKARVLHRYFVKANLEGLCAPVDGPVVGKVGKSERGSGSSKTKAKENEKDPSPSGGVPSLVGRHLVSFVVPTQAKAARLIPPNRLVVWSEHGIVLHNLSQCLEDEQLWSYHPWTRRDSKAATTNKAKGKPTGSRPSVPLAQRGLINTTKKIALTVCPVVAPQKKKKARRVSTQQQGDTSTGSPLLLADSSDSLQLDAENATESEETLMRQTSTTTTATTTSFSTTTTGRSLARRSTSSTALGSGDQPKALGPVQPTMFHSACSALSRASINSVCHLCSDDSTEENMSQIAEHWGNRRCGERGAQLVALATVERTLLVLDASDGTVLVLKGHERAITAVEFATQGQAGDLLDIHTDANSKELYTTDDAAPFLLSAASDLSVRCWDIRARSPTRGQTVLTISGLPAAPRALHLSDTTQYGRHCLVVISNTAPAGIIPPDLRIYDLRNGACLHTYTGLGRRCNTVTDVHWRQCDTERRQQEGDDDDDDEVDPEYAAIGDNELVMLSTDSIDIYDPRSGTTVNSLLPQPILPRSGPSSGAPMLPQMAYACFCFPCPFRPSLLVAGCHPKRSDFTKETKGVGLIAMDLECDTYHRVLPLPQASMLGDMCRLNDDYFAFTMDSCVAVLKMDPLSPKGDFTWSQPSILIDLGPSEPFPRRLRYDEGYDPAQGRSRARLFVDCETKVFCCELSQAPSFIYAPPNTGPTLTRASRRGGPITAKGAAANANSPSSNSGVVHRISKVNVVQ